jgi:hypothetical protein
MNLVKWTPTKKKDAQRPNATKQSLKRVLSSASKWNEIFENLEFLRYTMSKIKQSNIKRVKILNRPVHTPTFWEKLTKKHNNWMYHPHLVAVVDITQAPIIENGRIIHKRFSQPDEPVNLEPFFAQINHGNSSDYTWTGTHDPHVGQKPTPFKGKMVILQVGDFKMLPDYRKFGELIG